jgi:hypothetical protein
MQNMCMLLFFAKVHMIFSVSPAYSEGHDTHGLQQPAMV